MALTACAEPTDEELSSVEQAVEAWTECAPEWQHCNFTGTRTVRYGENGTYAALRVFSNGVACRNDNFGGDPLPGTPKRCWISSDAQTPPATTPPSSGLGYDRFNPILYSNDHPEDVHTDVIMMALQSNGSINLRGILTDQQANAPSGCSGDGCHTFLIDDAKRQDWINAARASGFRNIPDSVAGDAAVQKILDEARAASASKPLVILAGGPLFRIAEAYRRDPSIASRLIVVLAGFVQGQHNYYGDTNITGDLEVSRTVLENLRCVIVPFVDFNARGIDQGRFPSTPRSRVEQLPGSRLRDRMLSIYAYPWAHYDADGGPTATLLSANYVTASKRVRWGQGGTLVDDASSDDLLLTQVNGSAVTEPWWSEVTRAFSP